MPTDEELNREMGIWLGGVAPWEQFATYTFAGPPGRANASIWGQRLSRSKSAFGRWRGVSEAGALYWARQHLAELENWENGWAIPDNSRSNGYGYVEDGQTTVPRTRVFAFVGVERGKTGGLVHLHALLGNVGHLTPYCGNILQPGQWGCRCCMVHAWPCGIARVLPYNPALGAKYYVSKYVTKQIAEWELIGFPLQPQIACAFKGDPTTNEVNSSGV